MSEKKRVGLAAMSPEKRKEIARLGGLATSRDRQQMSENGKKGGAAVSQNREHMSKIGRQGGNASRDSQKEKPVVIGGPGIEIPSKD